MESACRVSCKYILLHSFPCYNKVVVDSIVTFNAKIIIIIKKKTSRVNVI